MKKSLFISVACLSFILIIPSSAWARGRGGGARISAARSRVSSARSRGVSVRRPSGSGTIRYSNRSRSISRPSSGTVSRTRAKNLSAQRSAQLRQERYRAQQAARARTKKLDAQKKQKLQQARTKTTQMRANLKKTGGYGSIGNASRVVRRVPGGAVIGVKGPGGGKAIVGVGVGGRAGVVKTPAGNVYRNSSRRNLPHYRYHYPYRGRNYWWWGDYWWTRYYDDDYDDVVYVQTEPPQGIEVPELPEEWVEIEIDGETYYTDGTDFFKKVGDQYVMVPNPAEKEESPDAVSLLLDASDHLGRIDRLSFVATDTMDHVQDSGQKIQINTTRRIAVKRPSGMSVEVSVSGDRSVVYDGQKLWLYDREKKFYGSAVVPNSLEAMIKDVSARFEVSLPLTDLLHDSFYERVAGEIHTSRYIGLVDIDGVDCHHLAFTGNHIDWELWVEAGAAPWIRKLAIVYKTLPQSPRYSSSIVWDTRASVADAQFRFSPPPGVEKVNFVPTKSAADGRLTRLRAQLEALRKKNRNIDQYIASTRKIKMYEPVKDRPDIQDLLKVEHQKLKEIGSVTDADIRAYETKKSELERQIQDAVRERREALNAE